MPGKVSGWRTGGDLDHLSIPKSRGQPEWLSSLLLLQNSCLAPGLSITAHCHAKLSDDTLWRHDLQSLGQKPITFYRQVLALCEYPQVSVFNQAEHHNLQATLCCLSSRASVCCWSPPRAALQRATFYACTSLSLEQPHLHCSLGAQQCLPLLMHLRPTGTASVVRCSSSELRLAPHSCAPELMCMMTSPSCPCQALRAEGLSLHADAPKQLATLAVHGPRGQCQAVPAKLWVYSAFKLTP